MVSRVFDHFPLLEDCTTSCLQKMELTIENLNWSKFRTVQPSWNWSIHNTSPTSKAQQSLWKRRQNECKSQRNRKFAMWLCLLEISEKLHNDVSSTWLPKHDLNKDSNNRHANMEGEEANKALDLQKELQATKETQEQEK